MKSNNENQPIAPQTPRIPSLYADTVSEITLGYPTSRIIFAVSGAGDQAHPTLMISMPTLNMLEMARNLLAIGKGAESQLAAFSDQAMQQVQQVLRSVELEGGLPPDIVRGDPTGSSAT